MRTVGHRYRHFRLGGGVSGPAYLMLGLNASGEFPCGDFV
jgi:hypothetical protein